MSEKTKKILAIVALVFVGIFTVAFVAFLVDPYMLGGVVAYVTLVSGVVGIGLFFVIKTFSKKADGAEPESDGEPNADDGPEPESDADNGPDSEETQPKSDTDGTEDQD